MPDYSLKAIHRPVKGRIESKGSAEQGRTEMPDTV
jgi:hypothetical protein